MGVDISLETCVFLSTIIAGLASGAVYDIFNVFRFGDKKKILVSIEDVILSLIICSIIVVVFYFFNSFSLRWYMFIGLFLGTVFYFLIFRRIFVYILKKILQLFKFIFKILLTPTRFLYKILVVYLFIPIRAFITFLFEKFKGLMNRIKIKRGILKNEKKSKKKHKKKKKEARYSDAFYCSVNSFDKRN